MKGIKKSYLKTKTILSTMILTFASYLTVYAGPPEGITTYTKTEMATKVKGGVDSIIYVVCGVVMIIGFVLIGGKSIFSAGKPNERASIMEAISKVGFGCAIIGGAGILAGFFYGLFI